ncbi:two-component sensor histidine kinase [Streptomyces oryzae]|uniref:histidine kinase n=1 Tax=Streptomyces oryzae TaxID=1434886 RepID=A0ABS3XGU9_9ACTN|nr:two-component sensor histidine kinase [Streptomyces oryzae]
MRGRASPRARWWAEGAVVALTTALSVQEAALGNGGRYGTVWVALAVVAGLSLAVRHRWPSAVAVLAAAVAGLAGLVLPLLVALFHLASRGRPHAAGCAALVAVTVNAAALALHVAPASHLWDTRSYGPVLLPVTAVVLGLWAGGKRRLVAALDARLHHLRTERLLRERSARLAERAAIAAEMHDVLAHRLSLIALHTGVLATHEEALPERVADRVGLLRTAATEALTDLRDVLGVLRDPVDGPDDDCPRGDTARPVAGGPALGQPSDVVAEARAAGQRITAVLEEAPADVPAAHRLAVLRIVQEALTNARKHAPDSPVRITVGYGPQVTRVEAVNGTGPASGRLSAPPSGYGLVGLRERVEALGGELSAGPLEGTGGEVCWRLAVRIPHPASAAAAAGEEAEQERGRSA